MARAFGTGIAAAAHDAARRALQDWIGEMLVRVGGRVYVDPGAVLESEPAPGAGIGWRGGRC